MSWSHCLTVSALKQLPGFLVSIPLSYMVSVRPLTCQKEKRFSSTLLPVELARLLYNAKIVGAEIYATVSTLEKRQLIVSQYGIAEDHVFCSRDLTFATAIKHCTRDRGVDVNLNSLSGEYLKNPWELIAPLGRFVEIGKRDAQSYGRIEFTPFLRNVTMTSVELSTIMRHKPSMIGQLTADAIRLFEEDRNSRGNANN